MGDAAPIKPKRQCKYQDDDKSRHAAILKSKRDWYYRNKDKLKVYQTEHKDAKATKRRIAFSLYDQWADGEALIKTENGWVDNSGHSYQLE